MSLGHALGIPFRRGGNWIDYWKNQPEVLFFGLYSEISGGQMPNKVTGATDYLTVAGVVGSETYQCPDTAAYIAADTDQLWHYTDDSIRVVLEADLTDYDFTRTIVKYGNVNPYTLDAIMVLSSDVDTAKMRDDFDLSIWWSGVLNSHGNLKGNKPLAQQYDWTPEGATLLYDTFTDTNGVRLADHVMDVGDGWTEKNGLWDIQSNKVKEETTTTAWYFAVAESGESDVDISLDVTMQASNYYSGGITFRFQDTTHNWITQIGRSGSLVSPTLSIYTFGGTVSESVNITQQTGVAHTLRVTAVGNTIKAYWDGVLLISVTDAYLNTLTKVGIAAYRSAAYADCQCDNFVTKSAS